MDQNCGSTYICDWKKFNGGYIIWLVDYPNIKAQGKYFFDCEDSIYLEINNEIGDNEASLSYVNDLPNEVLQSKYFKLPYYVLMGNYGGYLPGLDEYSKYFKNGVCNVCKHAWKGRNKTNLMLNFKAQNTDSISIDRTNILIFSEKIINVLEPFNDGLYDIRKVDFSYKKRVKFYEIIWNKKSHILDSIAVIDDNLGDFSAWKCSICSARGSFYQDDRGLTFYVPKASLMENNVDLFLLNGNHLCVSKKVSEKLKDINLKKISIDPVGVVGKHDIQPNPNIEVRYAEKLKKRKLPG